MDITEVSILHHVGIVLGCLWLLSTFNWCHPIAYFVALIYLYLVHERYVERLRKKLQFEERKQANQRKVLSDSETVRWLNHAVENIWPICMEQIASQMILLPIIPWFLEKYKPWTAKEASVQHLYLGRNPPLLTDVRVLRQTDDDHLVLELGMNFLTADDMSAILAVKLRKRLGFGMTAKLHITGMHVEGKVLVGVKFLKAWPFLSRVRVCFVEPPYFQMTVKPIFTHGLDVTELPGIAGWLDKLLSIAFEQTLVEPNMLVVDVEKFASPQAEEPWFKVDEKEPVAYAKIEVIEASDMKPSDLNGLADPYVKGHLGGYRFRTKIQKKTLTPKWQEEFRIPIIAWECSNFLVIEVRDKDHFYDDILGDCSVNINDFRDGQRHDMWIPLQNVKIGRLRLAITVLEDREKVFDTTHDQEKVDIEERKDSSANVTNKSSSSVSPEKSPKVADNYEPIEIEGQKETGVWVHHPGSEVCQTWEPRKGKSRRVDTEIHREPNDSCGNCDSTASGSLNNDSSSPDDNPEDKQRMKTVRKGLHKIGSVFRRSQKRDDRSGSLEDLPSPHDNIRSINSKAIGVNLVMEDNMGAFPTGKIQVERGSTEGSGAPDSPSKGNVKDMAKHLFRNAEKSARSFKQVLSSKSRKYKGDSATVPERENESDSSDDESLSVNSPKDERTRIISQPMAPCDYGVPSSRLNEVQNAPPNTTVNNESPMGNSRLNEVQTAQSNTTVDNEAPMDSKVPEKAFSPVRSNEQFFKPVEQAFSPVRSNEQFFKPVEQVYDKVEVVANKRDVSSFAE